MYDNLPSGRDHRTALVIDARNGITPEFRERYRRLLQSVNGENIKIDVYTLRGNASADGPGLVRGTPDEYTAPDQHPQEIDLYEWAGSIGYDMLIVSSSPQA